MKYILKGYDGKKASIFIRSWLVPAENYICNGIDLDYVIKQFDYVKIINQ